MCDKTGLSGDGSAAARRRLCRFCSKVCSSSSALLYHTRLHTGERPYICRTCNKGFIQKVHLQRHVENNHEIKESNDELTPKNVHKSIGAPTMVRSNAIGNRLEAVATQLKMSKTESTKCSHCDERFMGQVALHEHVFMKHRESDEFLDGESKLVNDDDDDDDDQVGLSDRTKSTFRTEQIQCQQCDGRFSGQIAYLEHVYETHRDRSEDPQEMPVDIDGDRSSSRISTRSSTWCAICAKHLSSPTALMVHMRAHSGDRPYTCLYDNCDKTFMHHNSRKIHMMSHSGHRPHACKVCGKTFTTTRTLKIHGMIHTGERPYGCKFCGRRFIQQIHLLRHIKSHIRRGPSVGNNGPGRVSHLATAFVLSQERDETTAHNHPEDDVKMMIKTETELMVASLNDRGAFADSSTGNQDNTVINSSDASNHCLNCQLFVGELAQLKSEMLQLKQFLGAKLTLMESRVLGMQKCLHQS